MKHLQTEPNFGNPGERQRHAYTPGDQFYEMLIEAHRGLTDAQSELTNARLVLLLANHIGDLRVLQLALAAARGGVDSVSAPAPAPASASAIATGRAGLGGKPSTETP